MSVVLEATPDANYEPSESEIVEYGKWLGMNLPEDNPFLWIAREGLKAPLPDHWKACKSEKGDMYYFNFKTGQSIWDHPLDEHFKELFAREKANPTARSVANGAARVDSPKTNKKESNKKKKGGQDSSPVASNQKKEEQPAAATTSKVQALKTLKLKRELPEELRIDRPPSVAEKRKEQTEDSSPSSSSSSEDSESSLDITPPSTSKLGKVPQSDTPLVKEEVVAGGGIKGIKDLVKSNSPLSKTKAAPKEFVPSEKEREEVAKKAQSDLDAYKAEVQRELQAQKESVRQSADEALCQYKQEVEAQSKAQKETRKRSLEDAVNEERSRYEAELSAALQQLQKELSAQKANEIQRLRDRMKEQLEREKARVEHEISESLESFTRERRQESEIRKEAQAQALLEVQKSTSDLKQWVNSYVRQYEEAYGSFLKALRSSEDTQINKLTQEKQTVKRDLARELAELREKHEESVKEEEERHQTAMEKTRQAFQAEMDALQQQHTADLEKLKASIQESTDALEKEKRSAVHMVDTVRSEHEHEIEDLKAELRKKAEEELQVVLADLTKEHKARVLELSHGTGELSLENSPSRRASAHRSGDGDARQAGKKAPGGLTGNEADAEAGEARGSFSPPALDKGLFGEERPSEQVAAYAAVAAPAHPTKDIKTLITEALREVFAESPFTLPTPSVSARQAQREVSPSAVAHRASVPGEVEGVAPSTRRSVAGPQLPASFQDQRSLVESERRRLQDGVHFVEEQRKNLEERRQQLKQTRHQWKQDVIVAKQEGVRASSKRGQLLNKVRTALEEQARGLEHDEAILRDSEAWLQSKEQRLVQLEQQIEEQERLRARGDVSTINCSVDTAALVTGFFKPQRFSDAALPGRRGSLSHGSPMELPLYDPSASSPLLTKALSRIEKRLDEVTSIINMQQRAQAGQAGVPSGARGVQPRHGSSPQAGSHPRASRSHSKPADPRTAHHNDPWSS